MSKIINNTVWLLSVVCILIGFTQCKDDDTFAGSSYGYVQFKLIKQNSAVVRALNDPLDYLSDAKKVKISMIDENNMEIQQTLNVTYFDTENAEFGVRTEPLKLAVGTYTLKGYALYDGKNDEPIREGDTAEDSSFSITQGHNEIVNVPLNAILRGKVFFVLGKDDSSIRPAVRGIDQVSDNFEYADIRSVSVRFKNKATDRSTDYSFNVVNTKRSSDRELFYTDTLDIPAGDYSITRYVATNTKDANGGIILIESSEAEKELKGLVVSDTELLKDTLTMTLPETKAIKDYLVLYKIWKDMKGESWNYQGKDANWVFDGRTVDTWGNQLGVGLDNDGRVKSLNLGAFNPQGDIPEEIGNLDKLEILYLGTHSEEGWLDPYELAEKGIDYAAHRMDIAKERSAYKHERDKNIELNKRGYVASKLDVDTKQATYKYISTISTYDAIIGTRLNSITSIPESIGKLKNLEQLYVANGLVTELPQALSELTSLTDLEIFNCPITKFPTQIKDLPLVSLNFSFNGKIDPAEVTAGLSDMCEGEIAKSLQLLYVNMQNLVTLPDNMCKLQKLGLLNVSDNKLERLPSLAPAGGEYKVNLVQVFLDNNQLTDIPDDFCGVNDMEKFSASNNKIEYFPSLFTTISYYSLDEIDLSVNRIRGFKDNFTGVRATTLELSVNSFDLPPSNGIMPEEFGKMFDGTIGKDDKVGKHPNAISSLKLNQCGIDSISPQSIENLTSVTGLGLVGNRLRYLPATFGAETFPYLSGIDVSFNRFRSIPVRILNIPGMTQIVIEHQYDDDGKRVLKTFETNIYKHPALSALYLTGNDIISIQTFPTNLSILAISDNPNLVMEIPTAICNKIINGTFRLGYDETQSGITGCPVLGIK